MASNPTIEVQELGQSLWLDYIHRRDIENGKLQDYIDNFGVLGMTSNPSIFQKAIGESNDYDAAIAQMLSQDPHEVYETLAIDDIQAAADLLRPIYERTDGVDGYVSLEVSPLLANDTEKTVAEAKRLAAAVDRPNLMIKIPATEAGLPAIEEVIASGINVNVTLIFSVENYLDVVDAYIRGLERRHKAGQSVKELASVASFFLSRIDSMVDRMLENNIRAAQVKGETSRIAANRKLLGKTAVANARLAYQHFQSIFEGERFRALREAGARPQRPLWASTSTKNPAYPDTMYVDMLIGEHTVNTLPPNTLEAFRDHGEVHQTITLPLEGGVSARAIIEQLADVGVDLSQITQRLQVDGVEAFTQSFEALIGQVNAKCTVLKAGVMKRFLLALGIDIQTVNGTLKSMDEDFVNGRIWNKDGAVWKDHALTITKIQNRLGWLDIQKTIDRDRLQRLQDSIRGSQWEHIILLGMGGSSLAPEVLFLTFGRQEGFPELIVLDSTDPARIRQIEDAIDLNKTLFIVASKSGGTVETRSFYEYFYERTGKAGGQFIAITDPGSELQQIAEDNKFLDVFLNPEDIGGRYSALSYFGMVPAAMIGLDLDRLWESADNMLGACGPMISSGSHPGMILGVVVGAMARLGRDKVSIYTTKSIASFGNWIEQLIAESLGKEGKGVLPVVGATVGHPHDYGTDRIFIYLRVDDDEDLEEMDAGIKAIREAGHPRLTLRLPDAYALAGEFFRWEFGTAVAGHLLSVNPFDEPNVTEAKQATIKLLDHYQKHGSLPTLKPVMTDGPVQMFADETTLAPLRELCRSHGYDSNSMVEVLGAQLVGTHASDYFAVLAYFTPSEEDIALLHDIQRRTRHTTRRAVTIGYGPRYLHSTGQLHKGGPNKGIFFELTTDVTQDIQIPGRPYSFGTLFAAQAAGDLEALHGHDCRAIRLHLTDVTAGLKKIREAIDFVDKRRH